MAHLGLFADTSAASAAESAAVTPTSAQLDAALFDFNADGGVLSNDSGEWDALLERGGDAFSTAIQEAERQLERGAAAADDDDGAPPSALDTLAYEGWAKRIAQLHVLDIDSLDREEPRSQLPDFAASAAESSSPTPASAADQLLRMRIMLAQEEARNVHLEDRVARLLDERERSQADIAALQQEVASLSAKNLQQLANSCANGCGPVQLENDSLRRVNAALKQSVAACEAQLQQLMKEIATAPLPLMASAASTVTSPAEASSADVDVPLSISMPSPPSADVDVPLSISLQASSASTAAPLVSPLSVTSPSASIERVSLLAGTPTLLRVRCALSIARLLIRHQGELDHLMSFKLHYLEQQTALDDRDADLEIERELLAAEKADHAHTAAQLDTLRAEEAALQKAVAHLAQQLQKHVGSAGLSVAMELPNALPVVVESDNAIRSLSSPRKNSAPFNFSTPSRKGSIISTAATPQSSSGFASPPFHTPAAYNGPAASPPPASGGAGGGWGISSWFGGAGGGHSRTPSQQQRFAAAELAADQARAIMAAEERKRIVFAPLAVPDSHWSLEFRPMESDLFVATAQVDERVLVQVVLNPGDSRGYRSIARLSDPAAPRKVLNRPFTLHEKLCVYRVLALVAHAYDRLGLLGQVEIAGNNSHSFDADTGATTIGGNEPSFLHGHVWGRGNPAVAFVGAVPLRGPPPGALFNMREGKEPWAEGEQAQVAKAISSAMQASVRDAHARSCGIQLVQSKR